MFSGSIALAALVIFWYMVAVFVVALLRRNKNVVNAARPLGFFLASLAVLWFWQPSGLRPVLVSVLVATWALRLALHILLRDWGRREALRGVLNSFLRISLMQGGLILILVLPVLWINTFGGSRLNWLDAIGVLVWLGGFILESLGDYQMTRFLKRGVRQYVRHPHFIGEIAQWSGLWLITIASFLGR